MSEMQSEIFRPWKADPDEASPEFQKLLSLADRSNFERKGFAWKSAPNSKTWSAFGDRGTTGLVGAYGDLIQFGTYLGRGHSGLFTADRKDSEEPYWVTDRTTQLQDCAERKDDLENHYGLQILMASSPDPAEGRELILPPSDIPDLEWVNYRWPRFKTSNELESSTESKLKTTTQWLVHDGLVLQHTRVDYSGSGKVHLGFRVPVGEDIMEIRDLDHVTSLYSLNYSHTGYKQGLGPNGYSWILKHDLAQEEPQTPSMDGTTDGHVYEDSTRESVAVIASIMQDGKLVRWTGQPNISSPNAQSSNTAIDISDWDSELTLGEGNSTFTEVVVAYKMMILPKNDTSCWTDFIIPASAMDVYAILSREPPSPESLRLSDSYSNSPDTNKPLSLPETPRGASDHIEFVVRRHLEHILSTCSIPLIPDVIGSIDVQEDSSESREGRVTNEDIVPVALTCGDVSFHRVSGSASLFAFSFLVEMQRRLQNPRHSEDPYAQHLSHRIRQVCKGHMQWLRLIAETPPKEGFLANYWVNGTPIDGSRSSTWLAKDSLLDAAFQIIKTDLYSELYRESGVTARCSIRGAAGNWMARLKEKEHRKSFAWPHGFETVPTFRLDDHVWIWRALKATDHSDISNHLKNNEDSKKAAKRFSHREVQREILRHFTTRNDDISGKRMLAVTRSCRETRFFLHARDTVLFHSLDWDVPFPLEDSLFRDLWLETIEAQKRHDENHEDQWDNALRYALAVVMGCRGHSLNKRNPQELLRSSLRTLLETSSPNGLFAGQLDATTKKPICFFREADRDFHFHCTFEIPYILLINSSRITEVQIETDPKRKNRDSMVNVTTPVGGYMDLPTIERMPDLAGLQGNSLIAPSYQGAGGIPGNLLKSLRKPTVFKKRQPFYHLLDSTNIVEIEEEWLYNYPAFLKDNSLSSGADANILMMGYLIQGLDLREAVKKTLSSPWNMILDIVQNDEELRKELCETFQTYDNSALANIVLMIVRDIGFAKLPSAGERFRVLKESIRHLLHEFEKLAESDPKDIDAIYAAHPTAADDPRPGLRAKSSSKSSRKWYDIRTHTGISSDPMPGKPAVEGIAPNDPGVTALYKYLELREVRMRFRVIIGRYVDIFVLVGSNLSAFTEPIGIPKPFRESFPGKSPCDLTKASMGFRFFGDFFDRYWTCHFVEYIPSDGPEKAWDLPFDSWSSRSTKNREWKQRKVLELYLFERIVTRVVTSTREIYERVRKELGVSGEVFSMVALDSGDYFSSSEHWQKCQETLQVVEDRLEHITTEIAKWDSRERDRGSEKPRWTRNDERKYSGEIKKRLGSSNSKVRDLRRLKADITVLKELLISRQDQIRNDLSLRSDENIRFFTYVTVVFLPLGFAASIFSMSEVPDGQLIGSMAVVAAVALILTGFALTTNGISRKLPDLSRNTVKRSYLAKLETKREGQAITAAEGNSGHSQPAAAEMERKQPRWYLWFWLTYVLIEKPARRVSMAYKDMKDQRWTVATGASVVVALFLLPYCLCVWLVQVVTYNVIDLTKRVWHKLKTYLPDNTDSSEDLFQGFMASLVSPGDSMRPFKLKEEPKKDRKEPQPRVSPKKLDFDQFER